MYYFAYCTLLEVNEMRKFCPAAKPAGVRRLSGYKLCFRTYSPNPWEGGCSLEKAPGKDLYGVLYDVAPEELKKLDEASGLDKGFWTRFEIVVTADQGRQIAAVTYVIPNPHGLFHPPNTYTRPILDGARAFKLPAEYIAELEQVIADAQRGS